MKRALILALLLAGALALLSLLIRRETDADPLVNAPQAQHVSAAEHANELSKPPELELPTNAQPNSREVLPADPESSAKAGDSSPSTMATYVVRVDVRYAESNAPIAGAVVKLESSETVASTNAQGRAELHLPLGTKPTKVCVDPGDERAPFVPYRRDLEELPQRGNPELRVFVDRGCDLQGIVVDADTRRALSGARVRCDTLGYRTHVKTAADGTFRIIAMLAGPRSLCQALNFECRDYVPAQFRPDAADLAPGAKPLQILLRRGLSITGRLVDSDRVPVVRAEIVLSGTRSQHTYTDTQGLFTFDGLVAMEYAKLVVATQLIEGGAVVGTELELGPVRASRSDIELRVETALELQVFATLPDGTPVANGRFRTFGGSELLTPAQVNRQLDFDPYARTRFVPRGPEVEIEVFSDVMGGSDVSGYLHGKVRVQTDRTVVSPHEVHVVLADRIAFEIPSLPAGANEIALEREPLAGGAIDVQLLDASSGRPVGWGSLTIKHADLKQTTSIQGESWIRLRAPPGTYRVDANLEDGPSEPFIVTIPRSGYSTAVWYLRSKP